MGIDNELCLVCNFKANGVYFGVVSCKACSIFYSRTIMSNKKYKCLHNNNCCIEKNKRNRCKCCRYQKCINVGMKKENDNIDVINDNKDQNTDNLYINLSSNTSLIISHPSTSNFAEILISKLINEYKIYFNNEKIIYQQENQNNTFNIIDKPIPLRQELLNQLEKLCLENIYKILINNFNEFKYLSINDKKDVYGPISSRIMAMNSCYITGINYPNDNNNTKMLRHYGLYFDLTQPVLFFGKIIKQMDKICELLNQTHQKIFNSSKKISNLDITIIELSCLFALIVYNQLDCHGYGNEEINNKKREITNYLYKHLIQKHGSDIAVIKLTDILSLQLDFEAITTSITNAMIRSLFDDHCSKIFIITNETIPPDELLNIT